MNIPNHQNHQKTSIYKKINIISKKSNRENMILERNKENPYCILSEKFSDLLYLRNQDKEINKNTLKFNKTTIKRQENHQKHLENPEKSLFITNNKVNLNKFIKEEKIENSYQVISNKNILDIYLTNGKSNKNINFDKINKKINIISKRSQSVKEFIRKTNEIKQISYGIIIKNELKERLFQSNLNKIESANEEIQHLIELKRRFLMFIEDFYFYYRLIDKQKKYCNYVLLVGIDENLKLESKIKYFEHVIAQNKSRLRVLLECRYFLLKIKNKLLKLPIIDDLVKDNEDLYKNIILYENVFKLYFSIRLGLVEKSFNLDILVPVSNENYNKGELNIVHRGKKNRKSMININKLNRRGNNSKINTEIYSQNDSNSNSIDNNNDKDNEIGYSNVYNYIKIILKSKVKSEYEQTVDFIRTNRNILKILKEQSEEEEKNKKVYDKVFYSKIGNILKYFNNNQESYTSMYSDINEMICDISRLEEEANELLRKKDSYHKEIFIIKNENQQLAKKNLLILKEIQGRSTIKSKEKESIYLKNQQLRKRLSDLKESSHYHLDNTSISKKKNKQKTISSLIIDLFIKSSFLLESTKYFNLKNKYETFQSISISFKNNQYNLKDLLFYIEDGVNMINERINFFSSVNVVQFKESVDKNEKRKKLEKANQQKFENMQKHKILAEKVYLKQGKVFLPKIVMPVPRVKIEKYKVSDFKDEVGNENFVDPEDIIKY